MGARRIRIRGSAAAALLALTALAALLLPPPARAQAPPSVVETTINRTNFPADLTFTALIDNPERLESAVLFYQVPPEGAITRRPAEISRGSRRGDVTRISATLPTNTDRAYIPPGADIEWFWQLTTTGGGALELPRQTFRYDDPRYDWRMIERGSLQLHYYENETIAEALLVIGADTIGHMAPLLGIELGFPARLYLWSSREDARGVERVESDTFEELIFTGGTRVLADLVHIFAPEPWIVAHELTHILTKLAGEGGGGALPAWLDEGVATYAEVSWRNRRGGALARAIETDRILSVRSIGSITNTPGDVDLFYGQSADIVTFLIERFGAERFAQLFAVFKQGSTVDNALQTVYGFDRAGLDAAYRERLGLPPRDDTEDRSTRIEDEPIGPAAPTAGTAGSEATRPETETPAPPDAADDPPAETDAPGGGATQAAPEALAEPPGEERTPAQITARRDAVERWNTTLRLGPSFGPGQGLPWPALVTGLGGGALLASLVLLLLVLRHGGPAAPPAPATPAQDPGGGGPPESAPPPDAPAGAAPPADDESA